jgi:hypothetical protein
MVMILPVVRRREEQQKLEQPRYSALQALASGRVRYLVLTCFGMTIGLYALPQNSYGNYDLYIRLAVQW